MDESVKHIKVDNWGIFFLQRLQMFFTKTDYCDLTLQFEGNVQLKVHRLVVNACTEYFLLLEQTCELIEDVLIMPADLQADVVLPIVNFMYTGMLEYHTSVFDKLYRTACLMNITVLTKLLDAQRVPVATVPKILKRAPSLSSWNVPERKFVPKLDVDLPAPLPGRKLPVWKRKNVPIANKISPHYFTEHKRQAIDPLSAVDNTPKPTRFDWPDDDLPTFNTFDSEFNDISYSSQQIFAKTTPLASTSFDPVNAKNGVDEDDDDDDITLDNDENYSKEKSKRKGDYEAHPAKRICLSSNEKENEDKQAPKISITPTGGKTSSDVDHAKIISEVLKKYPNLVKKNKNIRLKILAKSNGTSPITVKKNSQVKLSQEPLGNSAEVKDENGPWQCEHCTTSTQAVEFGLYYLYQKHMADVHFEKPDLQVCPFCSHRSTKPNLLIYHLFTKHGIQPSGEYSFPKCNQCPYIAINESRLDKHKVKHNNMELQCLGCSVTFSNQKALISHMQIMGHSKQLVKPAYDCQYCAKECPSSTALFLHLRQKHRDNARRDGIVSIDEVLDEEEYILPEHVTVSKKEKIKILSDVKLPTMDIHQQAVPLEPSSEAEALTNVASGIATSLGLVDVVVLDDNQQYILHADNEQDITGGSTAFVLPDLQDNQEFSEGHDQIITSGQNVVLHNSDISSTDELVMVLTDQDYTNEHSELLGNHSNIVVVYTHPVDQNNQFMPTGNIVLTSKSDLMELQNTSTIVPAGTSDFVTTPNQVSVNTQIESIELIQREINGNVDKRLTNAKTQNDKKKITVEAMESIEVQNEETKRNKGIVDNVDMDSEEYNGPLAPGIIKQDDINITQSVNMEEEEGTNLLPLTSDIHLSHANTNTDTEIKDDCIEEVQHLSTENITIENEIQDNKTLPELEEHEKQNQEASASQNDEHNIEIQEGTPNTILDLQSNESTGLLLNPLDQQEPNIQNILVEVEDDSNVLSTSQEDRTLMHSPPVTNSNENSVIVNASCHTRRNVESPTPSPSNDIVTKDSTIELQSESLQIQDEVKSEEESDKGEEATKNCKLTRKPKTAKIILDDWGEDTDSQQSDSKTASVTKLIDDWDDEDDESKK